ncbi:MAG: hypothetical protein PHR35_11190 [Kiritimatiellae bacterium]|nr:hypothetical protein [Kiritimatiellia bacterium]
MSYRRRFRASLLLACAGGLLACYAISSLLRGVALLLLIFAGAQLAVSVRDLHRHRHGKSYLRHAAIVYAPHLVVGLLLLAALRVWLILTPPAPTAISAMPPDKLRTRLASDCEALSQLREESAQRLQRLSGECARTPLDPAAVCTAWYDCLEQADRLEPYIRTYQGFHHVDAVGQPQLHADAFALGYAAYLQRLLLLSEAAGVLSASETARALVDRRDPRYGRHSCSHTLRSLATDRNMLRLHAGAAYLQLVRPQCSPGSPLLPMLERDTATARKCFGETTIKALEDPLRHLRRLARRPL